MRIAKDTVEMQQEKEKAEFLDKDGNTKIMLKFAKEDERLHPDIIEDIAKIQEEQEDGANSVKIMEDDAELELEEQLEELLEEQLEEHLDEDGNVKTIMRIAKIQQKQEDGANSIKIMEDEIMDEIMAQAASGHGPALGPGQPGPGTGGRRRGTSRKRL